MPAPIDTIVKVMISKVTKAVSRNGFGTMHVLGPNGAFPERVRTYSDLNGVAEDYQIDHD